jgi:phosphate transport system substrate-binding protein
LTLVLLGGLAIAAHADDGLRLDPELSAYEPQQEVGRGELTADSGETLWSPLADWAEAFVRRHPGVDLTVPNRIRAAGDWLLRPADAHVVTDEAAKREDEAFRKTRGYTPLTLQVGQDAVAIVVHPTNPLAKLTLGDLASLLSRTPGEPGRNNIRTWGDLGLGDEWKDRPVHVYGRNASSFTYRWMRRRVLQGAAWREDVREQPGSTSLARRVAGDPLGLGYRPLPYVESGVRAVPSATAPEAPGYLPSRGNVIGGNYALARPLWLYVKASPKEPFPPAAAEFARFVLSREGQRILMGRGFVPLGATEVQARLTQLSKEIDVRPRDATGRGR